MCSPNYGAMASCNRKPIPALKFCLKRAVMGASTSGTQHLQIKNIIKIVVAIFENVIYMYVHTSVKAKQVFLELTELNRINFLSLLSG